jgi:hypothetical protein
LLCGSSVVLLLPRERSHFGHRLGALLVGRIDGRQACHGHTPHRDVKCLPGLNLAQKLRQVGLGFISTDGLDRHGERLFEGLEK